ncbi:MAG TPA: M28 family peptidase [Candidatus Limnocylindria bacterium]|nr:M28 family peptidase [Candidatus Limnocylindria bacterium]
MGRLFVVIALCAASCGGASTPASSAPVAATATSAATPSASAAPTAAATPSPSPTPRPVSAVLERIDPAKLNDHMVALALFGSRDVRHPNHAKAVAYLKEQLGAIPGVTVRSHQAAYRSIPLENILAFIDPMGAVPNQGWVMICAHYDSISNRSPNWNPTLSAAPGADDNGTGTAALLEYARVLAQERASLKQRIVLAFFDGEELFFKGSLEYLNSLPNPRPYAAVINIDMVGFNPIADRLDLIWYTSGSAGLRDRVIGANERYQIGVAPLVSQLATSGETILDAAPFGLDGIPSVALVQRYGVEDATFPGNYSFHTVNDTPDKVTNTRLWLKAAKLTLATALELAR